jgi:Cytochrome c7 and related cytochrome c
MSTSPERLVRLLVLAVLCAAAMPGRAEAQLGALMSPGRLAKAHEKLEGASNCQQCHERGRKVTPAKCLTCHEPVAKRILEQRGVHKGVTDCVTCHVDHAGVDGELRPFDTAKFDHAATTGFALAGKHALACESCHKARSFLTTSPKCLTCHTDVHKGTLGPKCETCHPVSAAFTDAKTSFNHSVTKFPLTGAHKKAACAECHTSSTYTIARFACVDCHKTPHPPAIATTCASCHTSESWKTKTFDHSRTAFPLKGLHATVDCQSCHKQPATKVKPPSATCASCHADPHKGQFKQDCKACHSETGWKNAPFDHRANTPSRFALVDGHAGVACATCHTGLAASASLPVARKTIDFRGQKTACAACHTDVHQAELGPSCETCHTVKTFAVTSFSHPGPPDFYGGQHTTVACAKCHKATSTLAASTRASLPPRPQVAATPAIARKHAKPIATRFKATPAACAACHADSHAGQVGSTCETCHSVAGVKFKADRFTHDKSRFKLAGKHALVACAKCHKTETAAFPAGRATTTRYTGMETTCKTCHADVHLGQVSLSCETCHSNDSFKIAKYTHKRGPAGFFVGSHVRAKCESCHKPVTGMFPAGRGTTVQFAVSAACMTCHKDVHNGTLGKDCGACHRPSPLPSAHVAGVKMVRARSGVGS